MYTTTVATLWSRYALTLWVGCMVAPYSDAQAIHPAPVACVFTLQAGKTPTCNPLALPGASPAVASAVTANSPTPSIAPDPAPTPSAIAAPPLANQAAAPPAPPPKWTLQLQDVTLHAAFSRWAKEAGWRVLWDADKHLLIDSPDVVTGDFEQAITAVVSSPGIVSGPYPLEVCFYPNTPPLVRITKRGDQAKDCK